MRPKPRLPEESICQNTFRRRSKGTRTVSEVGGYGEGALLVQAHALDALVQTNVGVLYGGHTAKQAPALGLSWCGWLGRTRLGHSAPLNLDFDFDLSDHTCIVTHNGIRNNCAVV